MTGLPLYPEAFGTMLRHRKYVRGSLQAMNKPQAVSLDVAGTLIEVTEPVAQVYSRIAANHGGVLRVEALKKGFGEQFPQMPPMAFGAVDADALPRLERGWWRTLVRRVVSGAGSVDSFDEFFDELFEYYARPEAWTAFDEVDAVLDGLRAVGLKIGVLSNFDSRLLPILDALGITAQVDCVLYSTRLGAAKPDPKAFEAITQALSCPAQACLHVGDNPIADLEGAQAAGLQALMVNRRAEPRPTPDSTVIATLSELLNYFK